MSRSKTEVPFHPEVFWDFCLRWWMLDVNLLAFWFNNKLDRFIIRTWDPQAFPVGSLVTLWDQFLLICGFALLKTLPQLLLRIESEGIPVIFVASS